MNILALIAHPDDLEIAAAGTICRLVGAQHKVLIVVVTDEVDNNIRTIRQTEALNAAYTLCVPENQVLFLGQEDRFARNDVNACRQLQSWMKLHQFSPDVVITHSKNDTHQDHRAVHKLALSATRDTAGLYLFAAVINSLKESDFLPTVFVDTEQYWETKKDALACYPSQDELGRIRVRDIDEHEMTYANLLGEQRVEAFEASYTDPEIAYSLLSQFALPESTLNLCAVKKQNAIENSMAYNDWWAVQDMSRPTVNTSSEYGA